MANKTKLHFCDLVQLFRKQHGFSCHKTAKLLGLSSGKIVSKWECGQGVVRPHHLRKVSKVFKIKEHQVIDSFLIEERARLLTSLKIKSQKKRK